MSKQAIAKKLVPKLRFSEFGDEWQERNLEEVAEFSKGKGVSKADVIYGGKNPCIRYGELYTIYGEIIECINSYTNISDDNLVLSKANDVIIPASGETKEDIAIASCVINSGVILGGDLNIIRSKINGIFLSYYLNSAKKKSISQLAQGISVVHLYSSQLKKLIISFPNFKEQQKIVDCLSLLDDLIAIQTKKLTALAQHKKGLMQNLFPADGETTPKLRFPEFQNTGEWENTILKRMGEFKRGMTYRSSDVFKEGLLVLRSSNIQNNILVLDNDLVFIHKPCPKKMILEKNDIVICMSNGSKALVGKNAEYIGNYPKAITVGAFCSFFRPINSFTKFIFQTERYVKFISLSIGGGNINNLRNSDLENFSLLIPSREQEQQKIADCLSSLDDLITIQTKKLTALAQHKKGLMQNLFPNNEAP